VLRSAGKYHKFGSAISNYRYLRLRRGKKDNKQPEWWKTKQRKPRKDKVKEDIKEKVHNFYLSGNISREVPNKKDVLNIDNDRVNRHIMTIGYQRHLKYLIRTIQRQQLASQLLKH